MTRPEDHAADEDVAHRITLLRERIYATFTGLAVVVAMMQEHPAPDPLDALLRLAGTVAGIVIAGLVAEVLAARLVGRRPDVVALGQMARVALVAFTSALVPLLAFAGAATNVFSMQIALRVAVGMYALLLALIVLVAARRTRQPVGERLVSLVLLIAAAGVAVLLLGVTKLH